MEEIKVVLINPFGSSYKGAVTKPEPGPTHSFPVFPVEI